MARSEHATRRDPRDPGDLGRKRRVKHLVAEERRRPRALPERDPDVAAAGVPIDVRERGPLVHYPANADDVRTVLARLPLGTTDGLGRIRLCLAEEVDGERADLDPLGRRCVEVLPGVFGGAVLGRYRYGDRSDIELYGYTYAPELADRAVIEAYLRLTMLATLAHEVGHHVDHRERVARGRWRADDEADAEIHAEALEHAWTLDHVIPYLEEAHADGLAALRAWLVEHGGVALPLRSLIGDPRRTDDRSGESGVQRFWPVRSAFRTLYEQVRRGVRAPDSQLDFARQLHYGAWYDEALAVLDAVERDRPDDDRPRILRGDIYVHQERIAEAAAVVEPVLARDPHSGDALEVLRDVAQARGDWATVRSLAVREAAVRDDSWRDVPMRAAVQAAIELADWPSVDTGLAELREASRSAFIDKRIDELEALAHLRRGRAAEAFALASELSPRTLLAAAITFEAAHQLGRARAPERRLEWGLDVLRRNGSAAWADRLAALMDHSARS